MLESVRGTTVNNGVIQETDTTLDSRMLAGLLLRHADSMRHFVTRRIPRPLHSVVHVDDVLQDSWIAVYQNASAFRDTGPRSFERWLGTIVAHHLAMPCAAGRVKSRRRADAVSRVSQLVVAGGVRG